jgi:hypothetical protein
LSHALFPKSCNNQVPKVLAEEQVLHSSKSISELVNETGNGGCILAVNKNNNVNLVDMIPKGVTRYFLYCSEFVGAN